jgi:hypothetical protein
MTQDCTNADLAVLQSVSEWRGAMLLQELDDSLLRQLTCSMGIDFATAVLYQAIRQSPDHGPQADRLDELLLGSESDCGRLVREFHGNPVRTEAGTSRLIGPPGAVNATLAVVPGAFYREHSETGADGKRLCQVASSLGYRTHVISTRSVGSPSVNGPIICAWLRENPGEAIILCSLSKGGADVKMALAQPDAPQAFRNVVAWLNVGGTTAGSPMASWVLERPWLALLYRTLFWCRGQDPQFVFDLDRRAGSLLDFTIAVPAHIRIVHVLGFPLTHHIRRRRARRWHRRLACYGPNDGATILADSCRLPGWIFPVWGADHYFDTRHSPERLLAALLRYLAEEPNFSHDTNQPQGASPRVEAGTRILPGASALRLIYRQQREGCEP